MCSCLTLCFSGYPRKSANRTLAKLESVEKLEKEARKWKKSCQAPCFCQEEASSTIVWPCRGCLWGSWHQSSKWSRVAWSPSLMKYMDKAKFCSCQTLQVLITHFQLQPCSASSISRRCHKKQNPPHVPKLRPGKKFWGNPERVGLQGMPGSPSWAPAQAQGEEVPSRHGLRPRSSMSEPTQDHHP